MFNYLTRGRSGERSSPKTFTAKRLPTEAIVARGLAMTPSDIERLAKQGIAVSTPAADAFPYVGDSYNSNGLKLSAYPFRRIS